MLSFCLSSHWWIGTVETDPGTTLGGTWQRIEDRFLLAAGQTYAAGATGGQAALTLTEQQLPPHIHHVEGFTSVDSTTHDHGVPNVIQGGSGGEAYAESWSGGTGRRELTTSAICINHDHTVDLDSQPCGSGEAVGILPPYLAVYVWQRVS